MKFKQIIFLLFFILFLNQTYSVNVSVEWNKSIDYDSGNDYGNSFILDNNNNIYVLGDILGISTGVDIYLARYDTQGNLIWNKTIDYINGDDHSNYILIDNNKINLYVAGDVFTGVSNDFFITSYDIDGNYRWNKTIDLSNGYDFANFISIDNLENIYVSGTLYNGLNEDFYLISYDNNGNHRWNKTIDYSSDFDIATPSIIDDSGNIYLSGFITENAQSQIYIISYDSNGNHRWNKTLNYVGNDAISDIKIDKSNNIYLTGKINEGILEKVYTISYDDNGNHRWNNSFYGTETYNNLAESIDLDTLENIYITGAIENGQTDLFILSYDNNGNHRWNKTIDYLGNPDFGSSIFVDKTNNNIYITGNTYDLGTQEDIIILSYDLNGNHLWNKTFDINGGYDTGTVISTTTLGEIYILGSAYNGVNEDIYIMKLLEERIITSSSNLNSIFPNLNIFAIFLSLLLVFIYLL